MSPNRTMPESAGNDPLICCAYDGSVNAHWLARYGIHLASATPSRRMRLIHVRDRHMSGGLMERKVAHILTECGHAGVEARIHDVQAGGNVADAVLDALPALPGALLICGTRARARRAGLLAGTVSQTLLRRARCGVLLLRVVLPGLLGAPRRILFPVAANPGEGRAISELLGLMLPTLEELHLLRVMLIDATSARLAPRETFAEIRAQGRAAVTHVENELRGALSLETSHVDAYVRVAEDWIAPAIITASQHKCGLILAGASERLLAGSAAHLRAMERLLADSPCDVGIFRGRS